MSTTLDPRLARYLQISDALHQRILDGEWKPGDSIPAESVLAEEYNVALGTMRKSIQQLMNSGLLERQHGVGTFIRRVDFNKSLFRFFRFTNDAGERVIPESRILNRTVIKAPSEPARHLGITENDEVIWISRLRLIGSQPVLIEDIWLPLSKFESLLTIDSSDFPNLLYPLYEQQCDVTVAAADENLMVEKASIEHARALNLEANDPVILIERTTSDLSGNPLEWRRSRGAAEKFRYQISIN